LVRNSFGDILIQRFAVAYGMRYDFDGLRQGQQLYELRSSVRSAVLWKWGWDGLIAFDFGHFLTEIPIAGALSLLVLDIYSGPDDMLRQ